MNTSTDRLTESSVQQPGTSGRAFGQPTNAGFEQVRHTVADQLRRAAEAVSDKSGNQTYAEANTLKGQAADWLTRSADYVEEFDPQQAKEAVTQSVRRNPGRSLLIAGAVGLFFGALVRRR